jgi:hypothetical protein
VRAVIMYRFVSAVDLEQQSRTTRPERPFDCR